MYFTLEALQADEGDCLLLHYGPKNDRRVILIDGGTPAVYKKSLLPRLTALRDELAPGNKLPIELVVCSHSDRDHIGGLVELFRARKKNQAVADFDALWFNAFDDILGNTDPALLTTGPASLAALGDAATPEQVIDAIRAAEPALAARADADADLQDRLSDAAAVIASVPQAQELRDLAKDTHVSVNAKFGGLIRAVHDAGTFVDFQDGLTFRVLGPTKSRLQRYQDEWDKKLKEMAKKNAQPTVADRLDLSAWNLSSIVLLAEYRAGNRSATMLLTGDARGDDILESLRDAGLIKDGKPFKVDLLKIQHHGSIRNAPSGFFETVIADHYVISTNGKEGNPDVETLRRLHAARGDDKYTLYLTNDKAPPMYDLSKQTKFIRSSGMTCRVRATNALSVAVDLMDGLPGVPAPAGVKSAHVASVETSPPPLNVKADPARRHRPRPQRKDDDA